MSSVLSLVVPIIHDNMPQLVAHDKYCEVYFYRKQVLPIEGALGTIHNLLRFFLHNLHTMPQEFSQIIPRSHIPLINNVFLCKENAIHTLKVQKGRVAQFLYFCE